MADQNPKTSKDLDNILLELGLLSLDKNVSNDNIGANVPLHPRMILRKDDDNPADQTIELWDKHASKPALCIPIYRETRRYNLRSSTPKAVALLVRGAKDELWAAVSGWDSKTPCREDQLKPSDYVAKVKIMCASIGHVLAVDRDKDQGQAGRFYACHAEKQVLAYLFDHCAGRKCVSMHQNMLPCEDCDDCLRLFALVTGIAIVVVAHGENDGLVGVKALPAPKKVRYLVDGTVIGPVRD